MIPVILSGGAGTRLWPLSRAKRPKQFVELLDESLMLKTLKRLKPLGSPWALTVRELEVPTARAFRDLELPREQMLFEPRGRNTAPAVAFLCRILESRGHSAEIAGVFPADHLITDEKAFREAIECAVLAAERGYVATLGLKPHEPATGFGYIEVKTSAPVAMGDLKAHDVVGFREKPDRATAEKFVRDGRFFWNAGIFVFRVSKMIEHFQKYLPEVWEPISRLRPDLSNLDEVYSQAPKISIDYGIMEKLTEQVCVPCSIGWSDLGSWDDIASFAEDSGSSLNNGAAVVSSQAGDCFVYSSDKKTFGLVGVRDLIVVDTGDAMLIARRGATQGVREVVEQLTAKGLAVASEFRDEIRPWGHFTVLRDEEHFKSKVIVVDPMSQISYQSHSRRAEHWIFVRGVGEVVLDDETISVRAGDAVFIPLGAKHRVRNASDQPLEFVEVQTGSYFGEDDIQRFQDDYNRV